MQVFVSGALLEYEESTSNAVAMRDLNRCILANDENRTCVELIGIAYRFVIFSSKRHPNVKHVASAYSRALRLIRWAVERVINRMIIGRML